MTRIIVELCQNHNGDRSVFEQQIASAAAHGADIVKMQSIWSDDLTFRERFEMGVRGADGEMRAITRPYAPEKERLVKLDLTLDDHRFFIERCKEYGVIPMTTIFARHRIGEVGALPWPFRIVKVASYDCASQPFLRELAEHFDEFIISTGATYDHEIAATAQLMQRLGKSFSFLHCVTSYPNALEMASLARVQWLRQFTPRVGWSDHTLVARDGIAAAKVAIMLGADYVERHFTVLGAGDSKDGPVSITPELLRELSDFCHRPPKEQLAVVEREIPGWRALVGDAERAMTPTEMLNRDYYRGRFASPRGVTGEWLYNWEERDTTNELEHRDQSKIAARG